MRYISCALPTHGCGGGDCCSCFAGEAESLGFDAARDALRYVRRRRPLPQERSRQVRGAHPARRARALDGAALHAEWVLFVVLRGCFGLACASSAPACCSTSTAEAGCAAASYARCASSADAVCDASATNGKRSSSRAATADDVKCASSTTTSDDVKCSSSSTTTAYDVECASSGTTTTDDVKRTTSACAAAANGECSTPATSVDECATTVSPTSRIQCSATATSASGYECTTTTATDVECPAPTATTNDECTASTSAAASLNAIGRRGSKNTNVKAAELVMDTPPSCPLQICIEAHKRLRLMKIQQKPGLVFGFCGSRLFLCSYN